MACPLRRQSPSSAGTQGVPDFNYTLLSVTQMWREQRIDVRFGDVNAIVLPGDHRIAFLAERKLPTVALEATAASDAPPPAARAAPPAATAAVADADDDDDGDEPDLVDITSDSDDDDEPALRRVLRREPVPAPLGERLRG